jgi:hypothetical protein
MPIPTDDLDATQSAATLAPHGASTGAVAASSRLGRFAVLRELGVGGMGTVHVAYDEELDRKLAIKLLHARSGGTLGRGRLLREAQAMARLSHPNVVQIYEVGEHGPDVFVAMELVDGGTLAAWQRERPRDLGEIVAMYVQAGRGLAAAHAAGLVHRDFKPENVLVGADGRARVGDFGLARARAAETEISTAPAAMPPDSAASGSNNVLATPLTATGALAGTPAYMSPEQFHGSQVDAASDQFSFCAALYEALYARRPFAGETLPELVLAVTGGALRPPLADTSVPARLFEVLRRGLATDPNARWPNMDALLAELDVDPQRDRSTAPRERRRLSRYVFAAVVMIVTLVNLRECQHSGARAPAEAIIPTGLAFTMVLLVTLAFRRRLWPHAFHRNVLICALLVTSHSLALRISLAALAVPHDAITRTDMLLYPFLCLAAAALVARWFAILAVIPLAGGLLALAMPGWTSAIATTVFPGQALCLIYLWTRDAQRLGAREAT